MRCLIKYPPITRLSMEGIDFTLSITNLQTTDFKRDIYFQKLLNLLGVLTIYVKIFTLDICKNLIIFYFLYLSCT